MNERRNFTHLRKIIISHGEVLLSPGQTDRQGRQLNTLLLYWRRVKRLVRSNCRNIIRQSEFQEITDIAIN